MLLSGSRLLLRLGEFEECRQWIDRAIKLAPNSRDPHFESARLLMKTADAAGAAKQGEIALELHTRRRDRPAGALPAGAGLPV